jgi:alpha-tubulin suppressor-like RCC1 family protein
VSRTKPRVDVEITHPICERLEVRRALAMAVFPALALGCSALFSVDGFRADPYDDGGATADGATADGATDAGEAIEPCDPTRVLCGIKKVSVGSEHTCAVRELGERSEILCWGSAKDSQLGDGVGGPDTPPQPRPRRILEGVEPLPKKMIDVACGEGHSCATSSEGTLWCWGSNGYGEVGRGGPSYAPSFPGPVVGPDGGSPPTGVTALAANRLASAAVASGQIYYWGIGEFGSGAQGSALEYVTSPRAVAGATGARQVAVGDMFSCGLFESAPVVRCWGVDNLNQLGRPSCPACTNGPCCFTIDGVNDLPAAFVPVAIAAGTAHACVAGSDGKVFCWGTPDRGRTGIIAKSTAVRQVEQLTGVTALAAGADFTCALRTSGDVLCFGANQNGQLGRGTVAADASDAFADPEPVVGLPKKVVAIAARGSHACAVAANGSVHCWGLNTKGQLGHGDLTPFGTAAPVVPGPP